MGTEDLAAMLVFLRHEVHALFEGKGDDPNDGERALAELVAKLIHMNVKDNQPHYEAIRPIAD